MCCSDKLKKALFLAKNKPESLLAFDCNSLEKNDAYSTQSCAFNAFATPSMVCLMLVSSVDKFDEGSALVPYIVGLSAIALVANKETRTKTSKMTFIFMSPKIGSFCSCPIQKPSKCLCMHSMSGFWNVKLSSSYFRLHENRFWIGK